MKAAFQAAVRTLGLQPSEFWTLRPRYFWYLVEASGAQDHTKRLSEADRRGILEMLQGNDSGGFW